MNETSSRNIVSTGDPAIETEATDVRAQWQEVEVLISKVRAQILKSASAQENNAPADDGEANYRFGDQLQFGVNGNGLSYMGEGWHVAEASFSWSEGVSAYLHFELPPSDDDLDLQFTAMGYTNPQVKYQELVIEANGVHCCRIPVTTEYAFSIVLPRSACRGFQSLIVRFSCPKRASPSQFRKGADHRMLGIALHSLSIRENEISNPRKKKIWSDLKSTR